MLSEALPGSPWRQGCSVPPPLASLPQHAGAEVCGKAARELRLGRLLLQAVQTVCYNTDISLSGEWQGKTDSSPKPQCAGAGVGRVPSLALSRNSPDGRDLTPRWNCSKSCPPQSFPAQEYTCSCACLCVHMCVFMHQCVHEGTFMHLCI